MSCFGRYCGYVAVLMHIVTGIVAYQFDLNNIILYEDVSRNEGELRGSYFGYSVALSNTSSEKSWILIGAPRANSTSYEKMIEPGTVFKCEIGKLCKEWVMNPGKSETVGHGSWLGGSINIAKKDYKHNVLVCAPRWKKIHPRRPWLMQGMCYRGLASNFYDSYEMMGEAVRPLAGTSNVDSKNNYYYGLGQSGFSTHIIPDHTSLQYVLGCPGVYAWHGTPIISNNNPIETSIIKLDVTKDKTVLDNAYSGYAVTSGRYFDVSKRIYVTGAPRAANLRGKIILFTFPKASSRKNWIKDTKKYRIGDQIGEYFGSVLTSCDVDGDGKDDLLVGAPLWTKKLDEGRIYIFRGKESSTDFNDKKAIDGEISQGRFGSAITCLGDIDYDGYEDVAVGAPYDGNGAVYIYHGSKEGLRFTQKISAPKDTKGFGISISEPRDIDHNDYADIAVGAYLSGHVSVFRSKRVVSMTVTLSGNLPSETLRPEPGSFSVNICSSYTGKYPPQELNVTKELKIHAMHQKVAIYIEKEYKRTHTFYDTLMKFNTSCQNFTIKIQESNNNNFLYPLKLSVTQRLNTNDKNGILLVKRNDITGNQHFYNSSAVANETHQEVQSNLHIPFAVNCGSDAICQSNLSIHMTTDLKNVSHFVIGSASYIKLHVEVTNTGDEAYLAQAIIHIPEFIELNFMPPICTKAKTGNDLKCEVGNPLNQNATKNVTLELNMSGMPRNTEKFQLNARATTQSNSTGSEDHEISLLINCVAKTDIGIAGKADRDSYPYNLKKEKEQLLSIMFQHTYEIKNYEVTPIDEAMLSVSIPTHWLHGSNEVEVVKLNKTTGDLNGQKFYCMDTEKNIDSSLLNYDACTMTEQFIDNSSSLKFVSPEERKLTVVEEKTFDASLDNRTLHINCTNPLFKCKTINYKLGSFTSAQSVAKLVLTFDLLLPNFTSEIIQEKDIIFFMTNASARITKPLGTIQTVNNKRDSVLIGTMFIGSPPEYQLPQWLIPLSVFAGLLVLTLVILGLLKFGFFKRSKKMELEALIKEENNITPKVVLETTSSTEALDIM